MKFKKLELLLNKKFFVIVLFLLFVEGSGILESLPFFKNVHESNHAYLKESIERTEDTFILVSGVVSGLEFLQSSTTGFSLGLEMDVQVGEIIHHLTEIVDRIWEFLIASGATLGVIELWLELSNLLSSWFFTIVLIVTLISVIISTLLHHKHVTQLLLRKTTLLVLGVWLFFSYFMPATLFIASQVSEALTADLAEASHGGIRDTLSVYHIDQSAQEGKKEHSSRVHWAKDRVKEISHFKKEETHLLYHHFTRMMILYIIEIFVIPLGLLFIAFSLLKILLRHFEMSHKTLENKIAKEA